MKKNFDIINSEYTCPTYCVSLDWLEMICQTSLNIFDGEIKNRDTYIKLDNDLILLSKGYGSSHYKNIWQVFLFGEDIATIHSDVRNNMILKEGSLKIQFQNHILYQNWLETWQKIQKSLSLKIISKTRIDIALDTDNTYHKLMNDYLLNSAYCYNNFKVIMLGKADISCGRYSKKNHCFDSFRIGSASSEKQISIYNKSKEILERSHKEYIIHKWQSSNLDINNSWRFEMRLKSGVLNRLKHITIEQFSDENFLLSLIKSESQKFFEFRIDDENKNLTRKISLEIFPKIPQPYYFLKKLKYCNDGAYKAKLAIHNNVRDIIKNNIQNDDVLTARLMNDITIKQYHLSRWYIKKLPYWLEKYRIEQNFTFIKPILQLIENQ